MASTNKIHYYETQITATIVDSRYSRRSKCRWKVGYAIGRLLYLLRLLRRMLKQKEKNLSQEQQVA